MSTRSVLISMTRSTRVSGLKARMSIHPGRSRVPIATSRRTIHPAAASRRATYANASGMSRVTLSGATEQDGCLDAEYQRCPEGTAITSGLGNGESGHVPSLHQRDVTLRAVDPTGQRALPHSEGYSDRSNLRAEVARVALGCASTTLYRSTLNRRLPCVGLRRWVEALDSGRNRRRPIGGGNEERPCPTTKEPPRRRRQRSRRPTRSRTAESGSTPEPAESAAPEAEPEPTPAPEPAAVPRRRQPNGPHRRRPQPSRRPPTFRWAVPATRSA